MHNLSIQKAREQFIEELNTKEFYWRACRLTTLVDVVFMKLTKYILNTNEYNYIKLRNSCLKSLIVHHIEEIRFKPSTPTQLIKSLEKGKLEYIALYDKFSSELNVYNKSSNTTLQDEVSYLRIYNELRINDYPVDTIIDIIKLIDQD